MAYSPCRANVGCAEENAAAKHAKFAKKKDEWK